MSFNINDFKSRGLVFGGARPSLFLVRLLTPPGIGVETTLASQKLSFVCRAAELPEMTISQIEVPYFGRKIKIAGERTFADWAITVMNDEDFLVRAMFEGWSNAINTIITNIRLEGVVTEQYKADIEVIQFAKDGAPIRSYVLVGAFPTQIGAIALDWDSANAVETFSVNFAYDYWVPSDITNPSIGRTNDYTGLVASPGKISQ